MESQVITEAWIAILLYNFWQIVFLFSTDFFFPPHSFFVAAGGRTKQSGCSVFWILSILPHFTIWSDNGLCYSDLILFFEKYVEGGIY